MSTHPITLRLRSSSSENPQASRIIIDANGNRAVNFVQNQSDDDRALVFDHKGGKPVCTASVDMFNALWTELTNQPLNWQRIDDDLQESKLNAALPNLTSLCKPKAQTR